jgi:ribosomal protein S18 acetylase RimI-like enzyme
MMLLTLEIRAAVPADAETLAGIAASTFPLACPPSTTAESIAAFIAENLSEANFDGYLADPERSLLLAFVDGVVAGYTMIIFGEPIDSDVLAAISVRPTAELSKVYVAPGHHGGGIAQALVEASVDAAVARGVAGMWLGVNQENVRANRFYEKSGFTRVGAKRFFLGGNYEDDFVRERAL